VQHFEHDAVVLKTDVIANGKCKLTRSDETNISGPNV
jgi:hypothetical protein